jgi:Spy/CpxP family protein refolding chaperone
MKMMTGGLLVLAMFFATGVTGVTAQQGRRGPPVRGMQGQQEGIVESIMRLRESVELTEDQIGQLDAIRREDVQRRTSAMVQATEVQSQYAAGLIRRSDVMAAMEDRADAASGLEGQQRERLQSILTEEQQESLSRLRRQARESANRRGRGASRRGGPGFGGSRGGQQRRGGFRGGGGGQQGHRAFRGATGERQSRRMFRRNRGG